MAVATRGLHPLHFEDLDPHRFEDLVRQLAYEFRPWSKLEATGRSGADDGFDARGLEIAGEPPEIDTDGERPQDETRATGIDRLWLIQCKREKSIGPSKLLRYLDDIPPEEAKILYGIVFSAACDFSKASRDAFAQKCRELGLSECYIWGKGELEDMLFQPKNDHLLFAYFGISLAIRRRSARTELRYRLAMKRKAHRLLKDKSWTCMVIRDPQDARYPYSDAIPDFKSNPPWRVARFDGLNHLGIKFIIKRFVAFLGDDGVEWDAAFALQEGKLSAHDDPWAGQDDDLELRQKIMSIWELWPEHNRAWFEIVGVIPYETIHDIDELGDEYVREPHLYVPFEAASPFDHNYARVESIGYGSRNRYVDVSEEGRVEKFPSEFREGPERPQAVTNGR